MKRTRRHGQSTAEYAIVFAIAIGAVITMQYFVRQRLAGGLAGHLETFKGNATKVGNYATFVYDRTSESKTDIVYNMNGAKTGLVQIDSKGTTEVVKR